MHPINEPKSLGQWKRATQKAKTHLATMKRALNESVGSTVEGPRKQVCFDKGYSTSP